MFLGLSLILSGCGFHPIHASDSTTIEMLAQIEITSMDTRLGQILRGFLIKRLSSPNQPNAPRYNLDISLQVSKEALAIARDESATRFNMTLSADYSLVSLKNNKIVLKGSTRAISAFNVVSSDYATLVAERDAEIRAARVITEDLLGRLTVFFVTSAGHQARG